MDISGTLKMALQERLVRYLAVCLMVAGLARCRRFPSKAPPSWMKMHSHTPVSLDTFDQHYICQPTFWLLQPRIQKLLNSQHCFSALQCRLECDSGYVAQRTPLITCVYGEYAKGCHYFLTNLTIFSPIKYFCTFPHLNFQTQIVDYHPRC